LFDIHALFLAQFPFSVNLLFSTRFLKNMNVDIVLSNLLNPPVLFFFLGMLAIWLHSDLDIPQPLPKFFSLYLLLSIGFQGGVELHKSGFNNQILLTLLTAITAALLVPLYTYFLLRRKLHPGDAAAVAATYGSVSAVTFIAATSFLIELKVPFGGHMVAAMALMESPAIIVGVVLFRLSQKRDDSQSDSSTEGLNWRHLVRDAFFNGSVFLLMGSLAIGLLTGEKGEAALHPFTGDIFKGVLCLFLLDMGLVSARRISGLKGLGAFPVGFAVVVPLVNAGLGILVAYVLGLGAGDALLFCVLCASASYIAVPAAIRLAIPEANPGLYVTMALALTFPFNVIVGLPLYMSVINSLWR